MLPGCGYKIFAVLLIAKSSLFSAAAVTQKTVVSNSSDHLIDDESHDPFKDMCKDHNGEYYRETTMKLVCCGNDTLKLPDLLDHDKADNAVYDECSKKFKKDDASDFPTGMWKAFLCKLQKSKVFKAKNKITFDEVMTFVTKFYPAKVKTSLKKHTTKCKAIDSEKVADHVKIQKYMECFYKAENTTCHKPFGKIVDFDKENVTRTKELGCPVVPGLAFISSIEYCCKKRSTPYPIYEFPGMSFSEKAEDAIDKCRDSFAKKERELMPEVFNVATPKTDDDEDHQMHSSWDTLCLSACDVYQKNYTKGMLKLEPDRIINFYTQDFGKSMRDSLSSIIKRRKNKDKVFLAMDVDSENSKPMNFAELSAKFAKASEKEKIQYFCKFVETINFEERRALHEYCFDEKYANEWGGMHHSFFIPEK